LATALSRRNVPVDVANQVLDRFAAIGLIDDEAYAEQVATGQQRERALSGRAIAMGLRQRGVDDEVIARAIASMDPAEGRAAAVTLVTRKLRAVRHLDRPTQVRRLTAVLARRGHSSEACRSIVAEVLAGQPEADGQSDALDSADEVL
jgi:regulatory protein